MKKHKGRFRQMDIDDQKFSLITKIAALRVEVRKLEDALIELSRQEIELDDPHALIPKNMESLNHWLKGHPYPHNVKSMVFKNRSEAERVRLCCNNYQEHYKIVRHFEEKENSQS